MKNITPGCPYSDNCNTGKTVSQVSVVSHPCNTHFTLCHIYIGKKRTIDDNYRPSTPFENLGISPT
jgi:hypothetical protein